MQKLGAVKRCGAGEPAPTLPAWQQALEALRLPLYDVHWQTAVVLDKGGNAARRDPRRPADGRILPLSGSTGTIGAA